MEFQFIDRHTRLRDINDNHCSLYGQTDYTGCCECVNYIP
jgi:hypothetical protein